MSKIELNNKQQQAVNYFGSPLRIIAGAGSGKTRVIVAKIKKLMELGIDPSKICAITFTRKAANEVKERVFDLIKDLNFESFPYISTYHAFCGKVLREDIIHLNDNMFQNDFITLTTNDKYSILKKIISNKQLEIDNQTINKWIKNFDNKFCSKKKTNIKNKKIQSEEYYDYVFEEYNKYLNNNNLLDYDDLLYYTYKLFRENNNIALKWKRKFDYFLIDEFQDSNDIQFEIIKFISDDNLTIVGDPNQNIYTWRGANQDLINNFDRILPNVKTIILDENYRSNSGILALANDLIKDNHKDNGDTFKELISFTDEKSIYKPIISSHLDYQNEIANVCSQITKLVKEEGYNYNDITILYRQNSLSREIEKQFIRKRIKFKNWSGFQFYEREEIQKIIKLLNFISRKDNFCTLSALLLFPGVGNKTAENIEELAYDMKVKIYDLLFIHNDKLNANLKRKLTKVLEFTKKYNDLNLFESFFDLTKQVIEDFEIKKFYQKEKERVLNIDELLSDINNFTNEHKDSNIYQIIQEYLDNILIDSNKDDEINKTDFVNLMTIHKSKGLENKIIFIVSVCDGILPSSLNKYSIKQTEEERRLLYVAITRAKEKLLISYNTGKPFYYSSEPLTISPFIKNLKKDLYIKAIYSLSIEQTLDFKNKMRSTRENKYQKLNEFYFSNNLSFNTKNKLEVNNNEFKIGDKVKHPFFGEGTVIELISDDQTEVCFITRNDTRTIRNTSLKKVN